MATARVKSIISFCTTVLVISIVAIISWYAIERYEGNLDVKYPYNPPTLDQEKFWIGKTKNLNFPVALDYNVLLTTTSLSAQNEIDVTARAVPSTHYKEYVPNQWSSLPSHFYIIFPDAKKYPLKHTPDGGYFDAIIIMNKTGSDASNGYYRGTGKIYYLFEGEKEGYLPVSLDNLTKYNVNGVSYLNVTDLKRDLNPDTLFPVGSSDNTTTLHTTDVTMSLTYVLVAFGLLQFRGQLTNGIVYAYDSIHKLKN